MLTNLRNRLRDEESERGAVLMILALLLTVLLLCAGFAVDFGSWYARAEKLQNAADAAALAGAAEFQLYTAVDGIPTEEARGKAEARVRDVLFQNGIVNSNELDVRVVFPYELGNDLGEVSVRITDREVELYFSTFVIDNFTLSRTATAMVDKCGNECSNTVGIPQPVTTLEASGSGDGYAPIHIDGRMYGINHHFFDANIVCVKMTPPQEFCDNDGDYATYATAGRYPLKVEDDTSLAADKNMDDNSFENAAAGIMGNGEPAPYPDTSWDPAMTDVATLHVVAGTKIFFVGQKRNTAVLLCWETDTAGDGDPLTEPMGAPCANSPETITNRGRVNEYWLMEARTGSIAFVPDDDDPTDGRIIVFSDDHMVHCRTVEDMSPCDGYGSDGLQSGLGQLYDGAPELEGNGTSVWGDGDRLYDPDTKRIYATVKFGPWSNTTRPWGIRLICWDAASTPNQPCSGFGGGSSGSQPTQYSTQLVAGNHPSYDGVSRWSMLQLGRLFFKRTTTGAIEGICTTGHQGNYRLQTTCVDMDGQNPSYFTDFDNAVNTLGITAGRNAFRYGDNTLVGTHYYHEESNSLIVNRGFTNTPPTHCWSFGTPTTPPGYCGSVDGIGSLDYAYSSIRNCIFALGDQNKFYSFNPSMDKECTEGRVTQRIAPCICFNGDQHWGSVILQVPSYDPYNDFIVLVKEGEYDADEDALLVTDLADLIANDGAIDLDVVSPDYPHLYLEIIIDVKPGILGNPATNPWTANGGINAPQITVGFSDKPFLVD